MGASLVDIIICEDDPYYFLQLGQYTPKSSRGASYDAEDNSQYLANLSPSYLRFAFRCRIPSPGSTQVHTAFF